METDLTAKIAEVNSWIDEHIAWFVKKKNQYNCAPYDLKLPRLVDIDTTLQSATFTQQQLEQRRMDARVYEVAALRIFESAQVISVYLATMSELHNRQDINEESAAAYAVHRIAGAVSNYYRDIGQTLSQYEFTNSAQIIAMEVFLKTRRALVAVTAISSFIEYQLEISKEFGGTKAKRDAVHAYEAANSIFHVTDTIYLYLREQAWRKAPSATGAPITGTGASTANTRSWVRKRPQLCHSFFAIIVMAYLIWERVSQRSVGSG